MDTQQETRGQHTLTEIVSQPYGWGKAYEQLVGRRNEIMRAWAGVQPQQIIVTGCGSTHYLSQSAAALLQGLTGLSGTTARLAAIEFDAECAAAAGRTAAAHLQRRGSQPF